MTRSRTLLLSLAVLLAVSPVLASADLHPDTATQEPQTEPVREPGARGEPAGQFGSEIEVTEVLLDVLVTDRDGNVILGLGKDDFEVEEDGQPMDLSGVTFYSHRRFVESEAAAVDKGLSIDRVPTDRYFILFFHDQRRNTGDIANAGSQLLRAGREVQEWVETEALPNDWIAVVSYDFKLKVQQDFTQDRGAVLEGIRNAVRGKDTSYRDWPSRGDQAAEGAGPSLLAYLPQGKALRKETKTIYEGLSALSDAAGHLPGRKNLVLLSMGFGDVNTFGQYRPETRYFPGMKQALNDNNVAVYALDLTPLGVRHAMQDALNHLALITGGSYHFSFVSFATPLREISRENAGYYLLSYEGHHRRGESGFQKVTVRTLNPELKVRAREGYRFGVSE